MLIRYPTQSIKKTNRLYKMAKFEKQLFNKQKMIFFTFLGLVPEPVELGKIAVFFLKLGKIINQNSEEKDGIERLF